MHRPDRMTSRRLAVSGRNGAIFTLGAREGSDRDLLQRQRPGAGSKVLAVLRLLSTCGRWRSIYGCTSTFVIWEDALVLDHRVVPGDIAGSAGTACWHGSS